MLPQDHTQRIEVTGATQVPRPVVASKSSIVGHVVAIWSRAAPPEGHVLQLLELRLLLRLLQELRVGRPPNVV